MLDLSMSCITRMFVLCVQKSPDNISSIFESIYGNKTIHIDHLQENWHVASFATDGNVISRKGQGRSGLRRAAIGLKREILETFHGYRLQLKSSK